MKKTLLLALSFVVLQATNAQTFQWAKKIGSTGTDYAKAVTTDASGNVYSTGSFSGTVDMDPGPGTVSFTSAGNYDVYITKFNSSGTFIWARQIGGTSLDQGNTIKVDASGNVYVGGTFAATPDFDPGAGVVSIAAVAASDAFILKLDASGNYVWAKVFAGTGNEQVTAVDIDASGNVWSTGFWYMTCDFDPGPATFNILASVTNTQSSAFVSKLDNNGNYIWAGEIGSGQFHEGYAIVTDASSNVYVGGYCVGGTDFDPGAGVFTFSVGGGEEGFVVKLNSSGGFINAVKPVGTSHERLYSLELDASGNVIATGFYNGTVDFDPGAGTVNLTAAGLKDIFIWKLNSSLGYVWAKGIGSTADDQGYGIMSDGADNVYTVGIFQGTADFDPGAGTSNLTSAGGIDAFLLKLNSAGTFSYVKQLGGTGSDYNLAVDVDASGNSIYSAGQFTLTCDFDPDAGVYNLTSAGTQDIFIQKMGICVPPASPVNTTAPANLTVCYNSSASLSATGSGTLGWYTQSSGGTYLGGGGTYNTALLTSGTSFYVQDSTCSGSVRTQITVTVNPQISSTISSQTNVSCNGGTNGAATVNVTGGTPGYTYSWAPSGGTAASTTGRTAGTYTCTITDAGGCTRTQTVSITQPTALSSTVTSQTNVSCNGGTNGAATISVTGGASGYTYAWSPSGGTAATTSGRPAGTYTCTITDANGCTRTQTVNITQPAVITSSVSSQTNVSCNGGNNGAASLSVSGGASGYTYSWSPSGGTASSITGRAAGLYTCTITDANGCTQTQTVNITQPSAITSTVTSQTNILCNGGNNGAASISVSGGVAGYTYSWSPSGGTASSITGRTAGTYTCTITDASGCTQTQTVNITQPNALSTSASSVTNVSCNGGSNGSAGVSVSGGTAGYTYSWSPAGGTAPVASSLGAGTYSCTVTDANGCAQTQTVTITQPAALASSVSSQINISCYGGNNGSATILVSGGSPGYTYSWSPSGGTSATATNLSAGSYTCNITDLNGCTHTQTVSITEPPVLSSSVSSQTDNLCNGDVNGSATIAVSGGTGSYAYSWSPAGGTGSTASGLAAGTYSCTITDGNNCTSSQSVTITEPGAITASTSSITDVSCNGQSNGSAAISASGGTGTLSYSWSPSGGTAATASGLSAGTYTCTITDANNCVMNYTVSITEPAAIVSSQNISLCAGQTITVGSSTYSVSGVYTDVFSSFSGCDSTVTTNLTVAAPIDVTLTPTTFTITANQNGATYQWIDCLNGNTPINGATGQTFTPVVSGDYAVIVTMGSCSDTSTCLQFTTGITSIEKSEFAVYPNPTTGIITVETGSNTMNETILVYDAIGQLVKTVQTTGTKTIVEVPSAPGIYLLRISSAMDAAPVRVIKY